MSTGCVPQLVCAVVAVLLHYCYTAVFIWMLVEGLHLYSKVVRVFGTERSRMTYYVFFGWGRSTHSTYTNIHARTHAHSHARTHTHQNYFREDINKVNSKP